MQIYQDILKQGKRFADSKATSKFKVVDTLNVFWQQVSSDCKQARVLDASALLNSITEVCRYTYNYERSLDYGNIAPVHPATWIELVDTETSVNLAALILYEENTNQQRLARQASEHGIQTQFHWRCEARCFIKKRYGKTLPLKWEWIEYIDDQGRSVGSLMQPMTFPDGLGEYINAELEKLRFVQHDLCALIANLGLYTIDMLNNNIASLTACQKGRAQRPLLGKRKDLEHYIVELDFKKDPLCTPVPILQV